MTERIVILPATPAEVEHVAAHLRAADHLELALSRPVDPIDTVRESYLVTDWCNAVRVDDEPAILYGVTRSQAMADCGVPWMVATDRILEISREFILGSRIEAERMHQHYRFLINQVHCENHISIRWLRWLGFHVDEKPTGPQGVFFNFWRGIPNV